MNITKSLFLLQKNQQQCMKNWTWDTGKRMKEWQTKQFVASTSTTQLTQKSNTYRILLTKIFAEAHANTRIMKSVSPT